MLQEKISQIQSNISLICQKLGKNPDEITLVGVTKFASSEKIKEAVSCGLTSFGENKVQEAQKKYPGLKNEQKNVTLRMIGHLQTNKVKQALEVFDTIDSLDRIKLADEIEKQAEKLNRSVDVLIQVNTSGEEQKSGCAPEETAELIEHVLQLKRINIRGLMTIAPFIEDHKVIRVCFRRLKELFDETAKKFSGPNFEMKHLSMGMTQDYEAAIEEGSNMVRIGTAIFGT